MKYGKYPIIFWRSGLVSPFLGGVSSAPQEKSNLEGWMEHQTTWHTQALTENLGANKNQTKKNTVNIEITSSLQVILYILTKVLCLLWRGFTIAPAPWLSSKHKLAER